MSQNFSPYIIQRDQTHVETIFIPSQTISPDIPISTPLTFPFSERHEVVITLDKNGWWNPLGGHIEDDETWEEALAREAMEEAGVEISNIQVVGYIQATKLEGDTNDKYPYQSQLPITISDIKKYNKTWKKRETHDRKMTSVFHTLELFSVRQDNNQMYEVFKYIIDSHLIKGIR